ncbi:hypothetical protein GIB67_018479, partial [Kingdonia uniflora]
FKISHYSRLLIRSIRSVTETYNIVIQIYTLFEGRLLIQSIRSGRDALYSYSIFKISHYGRLLLQYSYSKIHALRGSLIESINSIWQKRVMQLFNIHDISLRSVIDTLNSTCK